jgi:hypothetical protein
MSLESENKEYFKLAICVFACATIEEYKNQIIKIEETWGKYASTNSIKVLFFLGEEETDLKDDCKYIYLKNVENDYCSASVKQNLGLKYIHDNYNVDFIFCCGTDTYINIPKLFSYIGSFDPNNPIYIGGHGTSRQVGNYEFYYHCGGAGFIITKCCLASIYPKLDNMYEEWSRICNENNSDLSNACDTAISYFLQNELKESLQIVINNNAFFSCNFKGIVRHGKSTYYFCCNKNIQQRDIISCHCMSAIDFDEFTNNLELNNYYL